MFWSSDELSWGGIFVDVVVIFCSVYIHVHTDFVTLADCVYVVCLSVSHSCVSLFLLHPFIFILIPSRFIIAFAV
jgi:hypothetical protein